MLAAINLANRHVGAALGLEGAGLAVVHAGAIAIRILLLGTPGSSQEFAGRTDIAVALGITSKVKLECPKMPSVRSDLPNTGTCGSIFFSSTIRPRRAAVP